MTFISYYDKKSKRKCNFPRKQCLYVLLVAENDEIFNAENYLQERWEQNIVDFSVNESKSKSKSKIKQIEFYG